MKRPIRETNLELEFLRAWIALQMTLEAREQTQDSGDPFLAMLLPILEDAPLPARGLARGGRPPAPASNGRGRRRPRRK
jgi:hypothetical protein